MRSPLLAALVLGNCAWIACARTWTDNQGRTLEAEFVSSNATHVTVRRDDGRTVALAIAVLSPADLEFVKSRGAGPANAAGGPDYATLNETLGIALLADDSLWDDPPAELASRLNLPLEGRTKQFEGYRAYHGLPVLLLGAQPRMISLQAVDGRVTALTVQFSNRGDFPAFARREASFQPDAAQLQAFDQALNADYSQLHQRLTTALGPAQREPITGPVDSARRSAMWLWRGHVFVIASVANQMVSLKITASERATHTRLADDQVRRLFKERITRRPTGDVILDQIPMVDQGPKGYCVPATFERYLRYAGIPADMYELAASGGTSFGGGTGLGTMTAGIDRYVRRQGRRLEEVSPKLNVAGIARYIDEGRPVIWALSSTPEYNAIANANTAGHATRGKTAPTLTKQQLASLYPERDAAHVCLIIGYNRATNELAVTDSWGVDFVERWVPAAAAAEVSLDQFWVLAW